MVPTATLGGATSLETWIRTPSFKGMLRFWWRAAKASRDISTLREEEARFFGKPGEIRSPLAIKISPVDSEIQMEIGLQKNFDLTWRFDRESRSLQGPHRGIGYLFFSVLDRPFWPPGCLFQIQVQAESSHVLLESIAALWLLIYLGGIGSRARRGGGCLSVRDIEFPDQVRQQSPKFLPPSVASNDSTGSVLLEYLGHNMEIALRIINNGRLPERFTSSYTNLSFVRAIASRKSFSHWADALNHLGCIYSDFRLQHRNDIFGTGAFGLPVRHRNGVLVPEKPAGNRRASPIVFKIVKFGSNYHWLALRFTSQFLGAKSLVKFRSRKARVEYTLVERLWKELKEEGEERVLSIPAVLHHILEKIKRDLEPDRVILFGSRARGDADEFADIDIAVETDRPISAMDLVGPVDVVDLRKVSDKGFYEKIEREGVLLHDRKA